MKSLTTYKLLSRGNPMYKITYLPVARKDIENTILYIVNTLNAPTAASNLLSEIDKALSQIRQFPYSCKVFHTLFKTEYEYRILTVKNYLLFYIVKEDEKIIEIHRMIYSKMNISKIFS